MSSLIRLNGGSCGMSHSVASNAPNQSWINVRPWHSAWCSICISFAWQPRRAEALLCSSTSHGRRSAARCPAAQASVHKSLNASPSETHLTPEAQWRFQSAVQLRQQPSRKHWLSQPPQLSEMPCASFNGHRIKLAISCRGVSRCLKLSRVLSVFVFQFETAACRQTVRSCRWFQPVVRIFSAADDRLMSRAACRPITDVQRPL